MDWYSIIHSIKKSKIYQRQINVNIEEYELLKVGDLKLVTSHSDQIYEQFLKESTQVRLRTEKYVAIPQNDDAENIYKRCHKYVIDTYMKAFQYKFLNDILVNNFWLKKWEIIEDSSCTFCNENEENIHHLFWECRIIKQFWLNFNNWINQFIPMLITVQQVFYGNDDNLLYTLIIFAKKFIFDCRKNNKIPNIQEYKYQVKYLKKI
jgi:hypothetical protein